MTADGNPPPWLTGRYPEENGRACRSSIEAALTANRLLLKSREKDFLYLPRTRLGRLLQLHCAVERLVFIN